MNDLQAFVPDDDLTQQLAEHIRQIEILVGENPDRQGLLRTPSRVGEAWQFLTKGYKEDPLQILRSALFDSEYDEPIVVKDIEFYSLCEHHLLPFFGKVDIAYIPNKKITGLSKLARVVNVFSRRLQVQETLTHQICDCIAEALDAKGVMVRVEARHLCMQMRGVEKQGSSTVTVAVSGEFAKNVELRKMLLC